LVKVIVILIIKRTPRKKKAPAAEKNTGWPKNTKKHVFLGLKKNTKKHFSHLGIYGKV